MSTTPLLIRFYDPTIQGPDPNGRTQTSILALPDTDLEYCHDYIQTLFPLPESSSIHPTAPTIDSVTFTAFRSQPALQSQLQASLTRMLQFYGFAPTLPHAENPQPKTTTTPPTITAISPGSNFPLASKRWLKRFNHNHLRITRIIRSLRILGLEPQALLFFNALNAVYDNGRSGIGARSMMFWRRAAERPLYLAPEDERDEGRGQAFLYEFEERRRADGVATNRDGDGRGGES
ncbi:opioid growth factor receptor conserved region-domain-containing protein [Usnea florida]